MGRLRGNCVPVHIIHYLRMGVSQTSACPLDRMWMRVTWQSGTDVPRERAPRRSRPFPSPGRHCRDDS